MDKLNILPPGSDEAIKKGCLCAVEDNHYGIGCGWQSEYGEPLFWITADCPLHGKGEDNERDSVQGMGD